MYGAIIGDLAGSMYEYLEFLDSLNGTINVKHRKEILEKKDLLDDRCFYSDDTILTMAILDSILEGIDYEESLKLYYEKYKSFKPTDAPYFKSMFSPRFSKWCEGKVAGDSYGNGAAMRISPIGYLFDDGATVVLEANKATTPSHDNINAIAGAEVVALTILMARCGNNQYFIKDFISSTYRYYFNYDFNNLLLNNTFNVSCEESVKQALYLAFSSNNFEEAIRKAVAIGGDTDTVACITGSIAEALYGIDDDLIKTANEFLPSEFKDKLEEGYSKVKKLN